MGDGVEARRHVLLAGYGLDYSTTAVPFCAATSRHNYKEYQKLQRQSQITLDLVNIDN